MNEAWSLTERPGYLRLKTNRIAENLFAATNTLTQRMEGATCSGCVALDFSHMKDGDRAGLAAFNGDSGVLTIIAENGKRYLTMSAQSVRLSDEDKIIEKVETTEKERIELTQDSIYLRINADFNLGKDIATFYYSTDGKEWKKIGTDFKMIFDYTRLFMGTRFALFNYATREKGGYVDVDFFEYENSENEH